MTAAHEPDADVTGYELYRDSKDLGEIEEILHLDSCDYCLVDTRHWTFGSKRLVPAKDVVVTDRSGRTAQVSIDVEVIRSAPDFDPFRLARPEYLSELRQHYGSDAPSTSTGAHS